MLKHQISLLLLLATCYSFGQQDFNNYKTLQSVGAIPADFATVTSEKVKLDIQNKESGLSGTKEKVFLEGIHYSIDGILHSNVVVYGDEISRYVAEVAGKLLKDDPQLQQKLRFYTLKSNHSNALSTAQGIIFVTTGLISQLTSEAQLAYILAHEISHYTQHHVVETFEYKSDRRNLYIDKLSIYSKDKEFEADRLALDLYSKAGYSKAEIEKTFDVLMYSYLPFDEVEFPKDYFNTPKMYIPPTAFPDKKFEIKAEEDVDDTRSSHPNIKKRKAAINESTTGIANWDNKLYLISEEKFNYIRNIARFESVRNAVMDAAFTEALYSIFLLEKEFPQSVYLKRMKAQCWLGISQFKTFNSAFSKDEKLNEGEIAGLHKMLKGLSEQNVLALAVRQNYDLARELPQDEEIGIIYDRTVKTVAYSKKFKLTDFSTKNFSEIMAQAAAPKDTAATPPPAETKTSSKYDRIKTKKSVDSPESADSLKFGFYGLSDVIVDADFLKKYNGYKEIAAEEEAREEAFEKLSRAERKKELKQQKEDELHLGLESVIIVEPSVIEYSKKKVDHKRSEELAAKLETVVMDVADMLYVPVESVSSFTLESNGTQDFNDRSVMYSSVEQSVNYGKLDFFPVDYQLLGDIRERRGKNSALFILAEHRYAPKISWLLVGSCIFILPALPVVLAVHVVPGFLAGHQSEFTMLVIDMNKGHVTTGVSVEFHEQMTKYNMGAHFYTTLKQLITPPSK